MIEKRRRDQILTDHFLPNEEILLNGNQIAAELRELDRLKRENRILREKLEIVNVLLECKPQYKRYTLDERV